MSTDDKCTLSDPKTEAPTPKRQQWPSRTAFILAGMGSAVGLGNLLRYPSVVYRNTGLQWFIPYTIALFFIGIPMLLLEISMGQAFRGGAVVALGRVSHRLRAVGLGSVYIAYVVATYYNVILAWIVVYFRNSFVNPLPWENRPTEFLEDDVIRNPSPELNEDGIPVAYPTGIVWETLGWSALMWVFVYLSIFKGASGTGKVVYFTMLLPLVMMCVITCRAVTLENAWNGIRLYIGDFHAEKLADGKVWQDAIGQIFFSIGTGVGVFTAFSSYSDEHQNAVQDVFIIACSNSTFEVVAGFAAFAIIGHLNLPLDAKLTTFTLAFITYPEALAKLPGSNVWAAIFFFMVLLLGVSSAFALVEAMTTTIADSSFGSRYPRWLLAMIACGLGMLFSIMYSTQFGMGLLDNVDKYINEFALLLVSWCQCVAVTSIYRWKDVEGQVGPRSLIVFQMAYFQAQFLGAYLFQSASFSAAISTYIVILLVGTLVSLRLASTPTLHGKFGSKPTWNKLWWLAFYSGDALTRDLNVHVATGNNWSLPFIWAPLLRWFTSPVLIFSLSQSIPAFIQTTANPLAVFGFFAGIVAAIVCVVGFFFPTLLVPFLPSGEAMRWKEQYLVAPNETVPAALELPDSFKR